MAYTLQEVENHRFFKTLSKIDSLVEKLKAEAASDTVPQWHRFLAQYEFLKSNVEGSEKIFIPNHVLNVGGGDLNTVYNHLHNYSSSKEISQINASIDHLSNTVENFNTVYRSGYKKVYNKSIDNFYKTLNIAVSDADEQLEHLLSRFEILSAELDSAKGRVDEISSSYIDNVNEVKVSIEKRIEAIEAQASARLSDFDKRFSDREADRTDRYNSEMDAVREKMNLIRNDISDFQSHQREKTSSVLKGYLEEVRGYTEETESDLKDKRDKIANLFQIVTTDSVTGDFKRQVEQESMVANNYRVLAMILMISSAFLLLIPYLWAIFINGDYLIDLESVLARLPLSTLLLIPAGYAARESGKHRSNERSLRAMYTQIAALDPYLESLPEDARNIIKSQLVEKYFVGSVQFGDANVARSFDGDWFELIKTIFDKSKV